jgi:hypothetical protein
VKTKACLFVIWVFSGLHVSALGGQDGRAQDDPDPQAEAVKRALLAKQAEIAGSVVTPCRDRVQAVIKPQIEHDRTCDCFPSESERQVQLTKDHRAEEQALARCDLKGLDVQSAFIDEREGLVRAHLRDMIQKFQGQASAYESWGGDAERGGKEAQDKIGQMLVSNAIEAMIGDMIKTDEKEMTQRIDEVVKHAQGLRDVRRVRTGELKGLVVAMRKELAGKSKVEAKQIILNKLGEMKLAVADVTTVEKRLAKGFADASVPRDDEPFAEQKTQSYLEGEYANLLSITDIAARHGVKDAKVFARAAGVLAFAPDAIDAAAILYNASAIEDNVSGLDKLREAAEQQRAALSAEMKVLVAQRRAIAAERSKIAQSASP